VISIYKFLLTFIKQVFQLCPYCGQYSSGKYMYLAKLGRQYTVHCTAQRARLVRIWQDG